MKLRKMVRGIEDQRLQVEQVPAEQVEHALLPPATTLPSL
jgi:hypothetical protein